MSKKMKAFISVLVVALLLTAGGTAVALADDEEEPVPESQLEAGSLLSRVAGTLDIPEEELLDAFRQAREDIMEERGAEVFNQMLDRAVEEGILTLEEADEAREWWEQRPEALEPGLLRRACGVSGPRIQNMQDGGWWQGAAMHRQGGDGEGLNFSNRIHARIFRAMRGRQ